MNGNGRDTTNGYRHGMNEFQLNFCRTMEWGIGCGWWVEVRWVDESFSNISTVELCVTVYNYFCASFVSNMSIIYGCLTITSKLRLKASENVWLFDSINVFCVKNSDFSSRIYYILFLTL